MQLHPLIDEVNGLSNRMITLDVRALLATSRDELEQWRAQSHRTIETFFERKCSELERIVATKLNDEKDELQLVRKTLDKLLDEQAASQWEIDLLQEKIRQLDRKIHRIEHVSIETCTALPSLDDRLIRIRETFDLESILSPPTQTINLPNLKSSILASNDRYLLCHQDLHLCLIDKDLQCVRKLPWMGGRIHDACWSSSLERFIVSTENCGICLVQEDTISSENVTLSTQTKFFSCTCSSERLYLSVDELGSGIMEFRIRPSIELVTRWQSADLCPTDRSIKTIRYNNQTLALIIHSSSENLLSLELRSTTTFDRLWSRHISTPADPCQYVSCLLNSDDWLLIGKHSSRVLHLAKDGQMNETHAYPSKPINATLFGPTTLAILTDTGIDLHSV